MKGWAAPILVQLKTKFRVCVGVHSGPKGLNVSQVQRSTARWCGKLCLFFVAQTMNTQSTFDPQGREPTPQGRGDKSLSRGAEKALHLPDFMSRPPDLNERASQ